MSDTTENAKSAEAGDTPADAATVIPENAESGVSPESPDGSEKQAEDTDEENSGENSGETSGETPEGQKEVLSRRASGASKKSKPRRPRAAAQKGKGKATAGKPAASKKSKRSVTGFRVLKAMTFAGVEYVPGDPFVSADVGCTPIRLRQLIDARRLSREIVTGKAPSLKSLAPRSPSTRAELARTKGEKAAERVAPRKRIQF